MTAEQRRKNILEILTEASAPISASSLALQMKVSRQIIVGDIALLRAAGEEITATPRGYLHELAGGKAKDYRIACIHSASEMEKELNIMVDFGCVIRDVIVEHPIYGQLTGQLNLHSRYDVSQFIRKAASVKAAPLSELTDGIHLHTVSCRDEEQLQLMKAALREQGFLYESESQS